MEEAAYLIEGRPLGGWDALVTKDYLDLRLAATKEHVDLQLEATKQYLDLRLEAFEERTRAQFSDLRAEFRDQTIRLVKWFVPTIFAGMSVSSAIIAGAFAALG
ncbi:MAG: hypothetical protein ACRDY6_16995 [Acidimicrobiia bacterium]